jgi:hypothetical protein
LGGEESFIQRLDALFAADSATTGRDQSDTTGLIGQYAHGNEPSHHMAWLYHYAGRPDLSGGRVREILDALYTPAPDGLSGNEDCGQMSSWYALSAVGLYQVCPCSDEYAVGRPLFDLVSIRIDGGKRFTTRVQNPGQGLSEIVAASLNGRPLQRSFLRHGEIAGGGDLVLTLGAEPGPHWGTAPGDRPRTSGGGDRVTAAPFVRGESDRFRERLSVELVSADEGAEIRYTLDPERPEGKWQVYREPLFLRESSRVRFVAGQGDHRSPVVEATFHRIPHDWTIQVASVPNSQYTAGGPEALIDGLRGREDWRTGDWQGYQYTDFQATVDLGEKRYLIRAGAGFLQDVRSWIWMPAEVVISVSDDGTDFREVARLTSGVPDDEDDVVIRDLVADLDGVEARYLRISARTYGTIPDWHPGHGDGAFVFIDEILVD